MDIRLRLRTHYITHYTTHYTNQYTNVKDKNELQRDDRGASGIG